LLRKRLATIKLRAQTHSVRFDYNELGAMSAIAVSDNGLGMAHLAAPDPHMQ
jgi:YD repeat-containing protein